MGKRNIRSPPATLKSKLLSSGVIFPWAYIRKTMMFSGTQQGDNKAALRQKANTMRLLLLALIAEARGGVRSWAHTCVPCPGQCSHSAPFPELHTGGSEAQRCGARWDRENQQRTERANLTPSPPADSPPEPEEDKSLYLNQFRVVLDKTF